MANRGAETDVFASARSANNLMQEIASSRSARLNLGTGTDVKPGLRCLHLPYRAGKKAASVPRC